jgi:hypothetical protein
MSTSASHLSDDRKSVSSEEDGAVPTTLNYLARMAEKPHAYAYAPPEGVPPTNRRTEQKQVNVLNARPIAARLTLDGEGFALARQQSRVVNFYDDDEVRSIYYPECETLLKEVTGAARVVVFDHIVRSAEHAKRGDKGIKLPAKGVHNDYTLHSGPQRVRDFFGDEAEILLKNRFAIVNVWRPIRGPVAEAPLAVCNARSMKLSDFVATDLIYPQRRGEIYSVIFNPDHRWFFFPQMQANEALLLKCYDSAEDGRARFTAHTAFDDPTAPADAPRRESIETRAFVFFGPAN